MRPGYAMREDLDRLDATTLRVWRLSNVVGWPLLALVLAMALQLAIDAIVSIGLNGSGLSDLTFTPSALLDAPEWAKLPIRAGMSLVIGSVIAGVTSPVLVRARLATAVTAAVYAVLAIGLIETYPEGLVARFSSGLTQRGSLWLTLAYEAAILLTIPVALAWRRNARSR